MINLPCILRNLEACGVKRSFTLPEYNKAVLEEASEIVCANNECRTRKQFLDRITRIEFVAIPSPTELGSCATLTNNTEPRILAKKVINEVLKWQFFMPAVQESIPRKRNYKDYIKSGFITPDEVHSVLSMLFPITTQVQLLGYLILRSRLTDDPRYKMPAVSFDLNLLQLLSDYYLEGGYTQNVFTRICRLCGKLYVDSFHPNRINTTFGYDPYCQACSGYGDSDWFNLESKPADQQTNIDDLELLRNYADAINTVPTKETMRSILASPCDVMPIFDAWVQLPSYQYYSKKYDDFRIPLIKIGVLPEQVLSGKYGYFCIAKDGHKCRSLAELKIDNLLFENHILHQIEPRYPYHETYNKNCTRRADWMIGNAYVEYWGLPDDPSYKKKMNEKKMMCEELDIKLIEIYQYDLIDTSSLLRRICNMLNELL